MEFQINSETESYQSSSSVTALSNGNFVVTWHSLDTSGTGTTDSDSYHISARIFNSDGDPIGSEFQVNSETESYQYNPSITALDNGGFVIVWDSSDTNTSDDDNYDNHLAAQIFSSSGSKVGSEFQVNTEIAGYQNQSSVTSLSNGNFIVTWKTEDLFGNDITDGDGSHVAAQIYTSTGTAVGSEFQINSEIEGSQASPSIVSLSSGNFVVTWESNDTDTSGNDTSGSHIAAQIYSSSGSEIGSEFQVNTETSSSQKYPSIVALSNGGFVVTWQSNDTSGSDTDSYHIAAQLFDSSGNEVGSEFQVNTQVSSSQSQPSIVELSTGGFVIAWQSNDNSGTGITDTDSYHIAAQIFDEDGNEVGSEFQVNTETDSSQYVSSIAALENGHFVITWESLDTDGTDITDTDSSHIAAQIFDSAGNKVDGVSDNTDDTDDNTDDTDDNTDDTDDGDSKNGGSDDTDDTDDTTSDSTLIRYSNAEAVSADAGYFIDSQTDGSLYGTQTIDYAVYDDYDFDELTIAENTSSSDELIYDITKESSSKNYTETLHDVERLEFSDTLVALDLNIDESAGAAFAMLYSVFNVVPDSETAGMWISSADEYFLDDEDIDESEFTALAQEMIDYYAPNGVSDEYLVDALYSNVVEDSGLYDESFKDLILNDLDSGTLTQASLISLATQTQENQDHYSDLIDEGLKYVEYTPTDDTNDDTIDPGTLDLSDISDFTNIVIYKNISDDSASTELQAYEQYSEYEYYFIENSEIDYDNFSLESFYLQDHDTVWSTNVYSNTDSEYGEYSAIIGYVDSQDSLI